MTVRDKHHSHAPTRLAWSQIFTEMLVWNHKQEDSMSLWAASWRQPRFNSPERHHRGGRQSPRESLDFCSSQCHSLRLSDTFVCLWVRIQTTARTTGYNCNKVTETKVNNVCEGKQKPNAGTGELKSAALTHILLSQSPPSGDLLQLQDLSYNIAWWSKFMFSRFAKIDYF